MKISLSIKRVLTVLCICSAFVNKGLAYTVAFYYQNLTSGPPLFAPANGGLLMIVCDKGNGFAPGPLPGAFVTGDDFVLYYTFPNWNDVVFDPIQTGVGSASVVLTPGEAWHDSGNLVYGLNPPGIYSDDNGIQYPVGSVWKFYFFPTLVPGSPPSAVTVGMNYAVATYTFTVPVETAGTLGMIGVQNWNWFTVPIPEPKSSTFVALALLLSLAMFARLFLKNNHSFKTAPDRCNRNF